MVGSVVVVGCGPGIGLAAARKFAQCGYNVGLISRTQSKLDGYVQDVAAFGTKVVSAAGDCGDENSMKEAFAKIRLEIGAPSVLIFNASGQGGFPPRPFLEATPADLRTCLNGGAVSAMICAQEVLPDMLTAGHGTIILTGATSALRGGKGFHTFAASKHALRALGQSMAREYHPEGIHIAHAIIDGQVGDGESKLHPEAIADAYWALHSQPKSAWSQEIDLRPFNEKW